MNSSGPHYLDGFLASTGGFRPADHSVPSTRAAPVLPGPPEQDTSNDSAVESEPAAPPALSWEEQVKQTLFPFDAFPRLLACAGADQPPSDEDRFRFQWFGLFYQGPENDSFVLRLRLPGGRLQGFQLLGLAEIVQELAGGAVEMNAQGGVDIPGVPLRGCVEALRRVEDIGLSARGTGGDCVLAVRGGEREGSAHAEPPLVYGLIRELEQVLAQSREFGDLPGPCEIVFRAADEWTPSDSAAPNAIPCLVFQASRPAPAGAARPDGWPREQAAGLPTWQVLLPGGGELGVALTAAETLPVCLALLRVWSHRADRSNREQAAWRNFCAGCGAGELRAAVEWELGKSLAPSAGTGASAGPMGVSLRSLVPVSRLLSGQMTALARLGVEELRLVPPGCLLVPHGVDAAAFDAILHRNSVPEAVA